MDSGKLLISIIEDILDLSKIEAGQLDIVRRPMSIRTMIGDTMKLAHAYRIQRRKGNISLQEVIDENLAAFICADQFRVQQVLNNL